MAYPKPNGQLNDDVLNIILGIPSNLPSSNMSSSNMPSDTPMLDVASPASPFTRGHANSQSNSSSMAAGHMLAQAFPHGFDLLDTSSDGLLCGMYAIQLSIEAQLPHITPPTIIELRQLFRDPQFRRLAIAADLTHRNHLNASQMTALAYDWGRKTGLNIQLVAHRDGYDPLIERIPETADNPLQLWVHNDDAEDSVPGSTATGHWMGMAPRMASVVATNAGGSVIQHQALATLLQSSGQIIPGVPPNMTFNLVAEPLSPTPTRVHCPEFEADGDCAMVLDYEDSPESVVPSLSTVSSPPPVAVQVNLYGNVHLHSSSGGGNRAMVNNGFGKSPQSMRLSLTTISTCHAINSSSCEKKHHVSIFKAIAMDFPT
jgi:hypothetical protein